MTRVGEGGEGTMELRQYFNVIKRCFQLIKRFYVLSVEYLGPVEGDVGDPLLLSHDYSLVLHFSPPCPNNLDHLLS